jgi:AbrB family looped-hinge helix DNA binding protein
MSSKVTIDKAGRVVLPKQVRDNLRLTAGSTLELDSEGERITLRPVRPEATLRKEYGIWVFQGAPTEASIPDFLDEARERRLREFKG